MAVGLTHADFMNLFDQWATTYDQTVYQAEPADGFEGYDQVLHRVAILAGAGAGKKVADVGAGTGNLSLVLKQLGAEVSAIEPSKAMRTVAAQKLGNVPVLDGQFLALPLGDATQDAIVSTYAFHHLTDPDKVVGAREMLRVLKPGGVVVLGDVAWANEEARMAMIDRFACEGKLDLVREIEEEYYPTVGLLTTVFAAQGCSVYVEQQNDWVWVLMARKASH